MNKTIPAMYRNGVAVVIVCRQSLPVGHPLRGDFSPAAAATGIPAQAASGAAPIVPSQLQFLCGQRTDTGEFWHFAQGGIELEDAGLSEADIYGEPNPAASDSTDPPLPAQSERLSKTVTPREKRAGYAIAIAAAYREAYEEMGLRPEHLTLVGPIQGPPTPTAEAVARGETVICGADVPAGDTTTATAAVLSTLLPVPNFAFRFNWFYEKQGRRGQQHYPVLFIADESVTAHCELSGSAGDRKEFQQAAWLTADELIAVAEPDKAPMLSAMTTSSSAQLLAPGGEAVDATRMAGNGATSALFHLDTLPAVQAVVQQLKGTCLSASWPRLEGDRSEQLNSNATLFSSGSAPRGVWAESGLGATIDTSVVETGAPLPLIDLCSMTANTILGINDPWVKLKQAAYLLSSRPHYLTTRIGCDLYYRVARRILRCFDKFGEPGDFVINLRQCNGSDAVELALHAAWKAAAGSPERRKLATFRGSYHGENLTAHLVSEHQPGGLLVEGSDNVEFFPAPQADQKGELTGEALATLSTLERDGDHYFAAIIEPIQWRNSVHTVPFEFLRRLRDVCTRKSICLIFDEMQNAFGYTGTISFAENCGVCPDISAISKALTSGHGSLAIIVAKRAYREIEGPFGAKSNSSNMLPLVAVDAVLDRLLGMDPAEAKALPAWLPADLATELHTGLLTTAYPRAVAMIDEMFAELQRRFPSLIGASKGIGLVRGLMMLGADGQPSVRLAVEATKVCLFHGVYVRQADTAVLIKPCMVLSQPEVDAALISLSRTFEDILRIRDEKKR